MATIRDVAKACGVSTATVSHVLNGRQNRVGDNTRERVLRCVREMQYRLAPVETSVPTATGNVGVMTVLLPESPLLGHSYLTHALDGIYEAAAIERWSATLFMEGLWEDAHRDIRRYCDGRLDGMLLIAPPVDSKLPEALNDRGFPFALVNSTKDQLGCSSFDIDHVLAAANVVDYLAALGHTRIAFVKGDEMQASTHARLAGYRKGLKSSRLSFDPQLIIQGSYSSAAGGKAAGIIASMSKKSRPTAVFGASDEIALGMLVAFQELGIDVPTEISVVGFDDLGQAASSQPPLTTVRQPVQLMAKRACALLIHSIRSGHRIAERVTLPTELIVRGSTAPPKEGASLHRSEPLFQTDLIGGPN